MNNELYDKVKKKNLIKLKSNLVSIILFFVQYILVQVEPVYV